ncbi:hypothetical protein EDB84DRAFT_1439946 [Lactarius hengduanensis]|nr:hypothetical protein EDB84DRAFT_1439946 [Lactarius hengduanensis]
MHGDARPVFKCLQAICEAVAVGVHGNVRRGAVFVDLVPADADKWPAAHVAQGFPPSSVFCTTSSKRTQYYCQTEEFTGTEAVSAQASQSRRSTTRLQTTPGCHCHRLEIGLLCDAIHETSSMASFDALGHSTTHTSYKLQQGFHFSPLLPLLPGAPIQREELSSPGDYQHAVAPFTQPATCPPRLLTYHPGPIPASFVERDDGNTAEYWSKSAGVGIVLSHCHVPCTVVFPNIHCLER